MVADTLMVVLDGNYKAKGPTLVWCQQVNNYRLLHVFWVRLCTFTVSLSTQVYKLARRIQCWVVTL